MEIPPRSHNDLMNIISLNPVTIVYDAVVVKMVMAAEEYFDTGSDQAFPELVSFFRKSGHTIGVKQFKGRFMPGHKYLS